MNNSHRLAGLDRRVYYAVFAVLVGAMTAICTSRGHGRTHAPEGWSRHTRSQPFVSQTVLASGPQDYNVWSLAAYQSFVAETPASQVSVDATLPERGRVVLTPHYRANDATSALVLEAGRTPSGMLLQLEGAEQPLTCSGAVTPLAAGRVQATVTRRNNGWSATIGEEQLDCTASDGVGQPAVTAGLRRVAVHSVATDVIQACGGPGVKAAGLGVVTGLGFFGLLLFGARKNSGIAYTTGLASLSGWLAMFVDGAHLAEILRLVEVSEDYLPLFVTGVVTVSTATTGLSILLARTRTMVIAVVPSLALFLGMAALWPVIGAMGWLYAVFGGLALGGLVWVNVNAASYRHYNLIAVVLSGVILGSSEVMVRFSHVGSLWNAADTHHGAGSMSTLIDQFEGLASGEHTVYPGQGFPVRLPPKNAPLRIVCLGASSTGGAFQNDSLDEFYPARLSEDRPQGVEVVNQGVGGWTSLHIAKFLESHADTLDAEIWTLYLGVNEKMPTRMSFADLYNAWKAGGLSGGFSGLDNIRLYQGLRLLVRGLKPGAGAGVPPADFRENLENIITMARARDAKVLLMSEGIRPDARILWQYAEVMDDLAQANPDVQYLDTAAVLDGVGDRAFIDSNHLTDTGHRTVARSLAATLNQLDWW